nr:hypothetical protein KXZ65_00330 [Pectobacterium sp. PL152]
MSKANGITSRWGLPTFEYDDQISYSDYELDNSAENEDWYDQISNYQEQIDGSLTAFSSACSDAAEQLELFADGEFAKSVIRIKEKKHIEWLQQKELEKLDKQSVTIVKGGEEKRFRIEWQDIENPPCDPENIRHIKTDGQVWLIVDTDECFYRSEDRQNWQVVIPDLSEKIRYVSKIIIVEGIWVIFSGSDSGFYYSNDAINWLQSHFPDVPNTRVFTSTEDLVYFNHLWLWRFKERKEYQYKEEGFSSIQRRHRLTISRLFSVLTILMRNGVVTKRRLTLVKGLKWSVFVRCRVSIAYWHSANTTGSIHR